MAILDVDDTQLESQQIQCPTTVDGIDVQSCCRAKVVELNCTGVNSVRVHALSRRDVSNECQDPVWLLVFSKNYTNHHHVHIWNSSLPLPAPAYSTLPLPRCLFVSFSASSGSHH